MTVAEQPDVLTLHILIRREPDAGWFPDPCRWRWYVTSRRCEDPTSPHPPGEIEWGFAGWRWTARWAARRFARSHVDRQRGNTTTAYERWIYEAQR